MRWLASAWWSRWGYLDPLRPLNWKWKSPATANLTSLDLNGMQIHSPKPPTTARNAMVLHTFGSRWGTFWAVPKRLMKTCVLPAPPKYGLSTARLQEGRKSQEPQNGNPHPVDGTSSHGSRSLHFLWVPGESKQGRLPCLGAGHILLVAGQCADIVPDALVQRYLDVPNYS